MSDLAGPGALDARHRALILAAAQRRWMTEWTPPPGILVSVGDGETFYALAVDGQRVAFVETQRGAARTQAHFDSVADAAHHLLNVLAPPAVVALLEADLTMIERVLEPAGMRARPPKVSEVIAVTDLETSYVVLGDRRHGRFEEHQRGALTRTLTTSTVAVALGFLLFQLAETARPTDWPMIGPSDYAPGVKLEAVADGQRLTWPGGWLLFGRERSAEISARPFSWVVRAPAAMVAASLLAPSGAPLFPSDRPR